MTCLHGKNSWQMQWTTLQPLLIYRLIRLTLRCQRTAYTSWQKLLGYRQIPSICWKTWQLQDSDC